MSTPAEPLRPVHLSRANGRGVVDASKRPVLADLTMKAPPDAVLAEARRAATALFEVVNDTEASVSIDGRRYLKFEAWQTLGRFFNVGAKVMQSAPITIGKVDGFEARAVVVHAATGQELSAADAVCLRDERNWRNRPSYMLRSMAQTRACAKALRNLLSWIAVLAGYQPTPSEEMEIDVRISESNSAPESSNTDQPSDPSVAAFEDVNEIWEALRDSDTRERDFWGTITEWKKSGRDFTCYTADDARSRHDGCLSRFGENRAAFHWLRKARTIFKGQIIRAGRADLLEGAS